MTTKRVTITVTVTEAHLPLLRQLWAAGAVFSPGAIAGLKHLRGASSASVQIAPEIIPNLRGVPASVDPSM